MTALLARLADFTYRRRRLTLLAWVAVLILIFPATNALKGGGKQDCPPFKAA